MKLEARCGAASSEVPKPENKATFRRLEGEAATSRSGSRPEAESETPGAESGPEAKAKPLGANPRSRSRPDAKAKPLVSVVAQNGILRRCWPSRGASPVDLDHYVPSHYHSRLRDPDGTVVLAKRKGVVRVGAQVKAG